MDSAIFDPDFENRGNLVTEIRSCQVHVSAENHDALVDGNHLWFGDGTGRDFLEERTGDTVSAVAAASLPGEDCVVLGIGVDMAGEIEVDGEEETVPGMYHADAFAYLSPEEARTVAENLLKKVEEVDVEGD